MYRDFFDDTPLHELFAESTIEMRTENNYIWMNNKQIEEAIVVSHVLNGDIKFILRHGNPWTTCDQAPNNDKYGIFAHRRIHKYKEENHNNVRYDKFVYNRELSLSLWDRHIRFMREELSTQRPKRKHVTVDDYLKKFKEIVNREAFPCLTSPSNHFSDTGSIQPSMSLRFPEDDAPITPSQRFQYEVSAAYYQSLIIRHPILVYYVQSSDWFDLSFTRTILKIISSTIIRNFTIHLDSFLPAEVLDNEELAKFILDECKSDKETWFQYLSPRIRSMKIYAEKALDIDAINLQYIPEEHRTTALCRQAILKQADAIRYCTKDLLSNRDFLMELARSSLGRVQASAYFSIISDSLKNDEDFVFQFITAIGLPQVELAWLPDWLKDDEKFYLRLQNANLFFYYSIQWFSKRLRNKYSACMVDIDPSHFKYFSYKVRSNKEFIKLYFRKMGNTYNADLNDILFHLPMKFISDIDFLVELISSMERFFSSQGPVDRKIQSSDHINMAQVLRKRKYQNTIFGQFSEEHLSNMTFGELKRISLNKKLTANLLEHIHEEAEEDEPISKI